MSLYIYMQSSTSNIKKKKKNKSKAAYEKELARQIAMIAMAQEETDKMHSEIKKNPALAVKDDNAPKFTMAPAKSPKSKDMTRIYRNDSGASSLDYSLDSSMLSGVDSLTLGGMSSSRNPDDEYSQTSEAAAAAGVPSDEELFAIGWAKAFDPKSGSYYYFTLDRSKIVWDNPLEDTHTEASSSILA